MSKTHLIIPDSHAEPDNLKGDGLRRYRWLGELICDIKPDVVVDIGDWFDMASLCSYDRGTKGFEGRRYKKDIEAGVKAQDILLSTVRKQKKKLPRFVRTLGNHENRVNRAVNADAILEGTIGQSDFQSKEYKWEEYDFLKPADIDGVLYQHYFTSGVMGRPIGGVNHARSLITKQMTSCTQGHSHLFDYAIMADARGNNLHGCVVGSYFEGEHDYAGPANAMHWKGVVVKRGVENGQYDMEQISMKRIKDAYG